MPEQTPTPASPPKAAIIGAVVGTLICASFGRVWLSMTARELHGWRPAVEGAGWVVLGLFVVAGVLVAVNIVRHPPRWDGERPRQAWGAWFGVVVAVEVGLLMAGQALLTDTFGHPEWIPVWMLFVVGAHFWPFALIFRIEAFRVLAVALCAAAVVSALGAGLVGRAPLWTVLPGHGGAAVLWGFAAWALHRLARGRSLRGG